MFFFALLIDVMSQNQLKFPTVKQFKAMMTNNNFIPSINPFDGNPSMLKFFLQQIDELAQENQWTTQKKVMFFKSKLIGTALQFFIQSDCSLPNQTYDQIKKNFLSYFTEESPQASIMDLTTFQLLQGESIKSLAHRLDNIINRVYKDVPDQSSLSHIKKTHMLQALPIHIRTKILEEKIETYDNVIKRAQELHAIHSHVTENPSVPHSAYFDDLSKKINFISEQVNVIKSSQSSDDKSKVRQSASKQNSPQSSDKYVNKRKFKRSPNNNKSFHHYKNSSDYDGRRHFVSYRNDFVPKNSFSKHRWFPKNSNFPNHNFRKFNYVPNHNANRVQNNSHFSCHFCGRFGHRMATCRQFLQVIKSRQNVTSETQLNPNAFSFKPNLN